MPRPSYDELDAAYRAALRRIAHLERQRGEYRDALLALKGFIFGAVQRIDSILLTLAREQQTHNLGHELDAIASSDVKVPQ